MITLANGNKFRSSPSDPKELEGYSPDPNSPNILVQNFLPCKHRVWKVCSTCPKTKQKNKRPTCKLKRITAALTCVGCSEREV